MLFECHRQKVAGFFNYLSTSGLSWARILAEILAGIKFHDRLYYAPAHLDLVAVLRHLFEFWNPGVQLLNLFDNFLF